MTRVPSAKTSQVLLPLVCAGFLSTIGHQVQAQDPPAPITCGDEIKGMILLDRHLVCATDPGLTVRGELDLNGFSVTCDGSEIGILLKGRGAGLYNGEVSGCVTAVVLAGRGRHAVVRVTARAGEQAFLSKSRANRLVGNTASTDNGNAFHITGARSMLIENKVTSAGGSGFEIRGDRTTLAHNFVVGTKGPGIEIGSSGNQILGNTVNRAAEDAMRLRVDGNRVAGNTLSSAGVGLLLQHGGGRAKGNEVVGNTVIANAESGIMVDVSSTKNRILGNEVMGNGARAGGIDLADAHPNCANNVWEGNVFEHGEPATCVR